MEWKKQGFIDTSDALHRVIASQRFSHRTNRKAHFFIQPSLDALDQFIRQKLILLHLECPLVLDTWVASFQIPGLDSLRLPGLGIAL